MINLRPLFLFAIVMGCSIVSFSQPIKVKVNLSVDPSYAGHDSLARRAAQAMEDVINSPEFKQRVLAGTYKKTNALSNSQLYDRIMLARANAGSNMTVTIPITVGDVTGLGISSYETIVQFDLNVVQPAIIPYDTTTTLTPALYQVFVDRTQPANRLIVGSFGFTQPLAGGGTSVKRKFTVVGSLGGM